MKGDNNLMSLIIWAAIMALIGAIFVGVIADTTKINTEVTNVVNESIAIINSTAALTINITAIYTLANGRNIENCPISAYNIYMSNGTALRETTDYTMNAANGTFLLKNNSNTIGIIYSDATLNRTLSSYSYCGSNYIDSSWGRSVLRMTGGFLALMVFAILVGIAIAIYTKTKSD